MEATFNDSAGSNRADGQAIRDQASDMAKKIRDAGGQEVRDLMADVQDLLGKVAHVADPEIARLRAKVEGGLATAKQAFATGADQVQRTGRAAAAAGDDYVRTQPWQAVGIAAVAGLLIGFLAGRR